MLMKAQHQLVLLVMSFTIPQSLAALVESVKGPQGDSCNVVNVYFGANPKDEPHNLEEMTVCQENSSECRQSESETVTVFTKTTNAKSCQNLLQKGITQSGYYLIMADFGSQKKPTYRYCNFQPYSNVSSCEELKESHNVSQHGYYRFLDHSGQLRFQYCPGPNVTCEQLSLSFGIRKSGLYQLGSPGNEFQVYCNFFSGQAVTEVWHDLMQEGEAVASCSTQGCHTATPNYQISLPNIIKIVENSHECRQYIEMRCQGSVLLHKPNPYAWWVSREGEKMYYWGGAVSERKYYCACGETGSCVNNNFYCNCDSNDATISTQDEGYLTDKTKLPVKEMKFGDLDESGEKAWHTLGKLECTG